MENRTNNNTNFDFFESLVKATTLIHRPDSLEEHFIRAFKNARQMMNYKYKTSFSEYSTILARWKRPFEKNFNERKNELYFMRSGMKNGTMRVTPVDGESIEQTRKSNIAYCETQLKALNIHQFGAHIPELFSIGIILSYKDILVIEKALGLSYFHILGKKAIKQRLKEIAKGEDINEQKLKGIKIELPRDKIKSIYAGMIENKFFKTDEKNFINFCTEKECHPIEWAIKYSNKPHKGALREFLEFLGVDVKKKLEGYFVDERGKAISFAKPKKDNYSFHYKSLEAIFK